jgi:type I restriction enzyme S subunit
MSEWKIYKLGDIGRIITGKTPPTIKKEYFDGDYPFITPVDMNGQKSIYSASRSLSEAGKHLLRNNLLESNTICVSCIGSDLGKVVKTTKKSFTNQQINSIICNENFDPDFIYYALTFISPELRSVGHHSTAVPIINKTDFSLFKIRTPKDKNIQTKIASILSSLDDKIELNRQTNQTLEAIAQTLFQEMCVPKGEELPEGWRVVKLRDVVEINPKLSLKKGSISKYIEMKDLSENSMIIKRCVDREFASGSKFQNGDTLLARITPCLENGKTGMVNLLDGDEVGWGSTEFIVLREKKGLGKYFVYCLARTNTFREYAIQSMVGSSGRQRVVDSILADFDLDIPTESILGDFHNIVKPMFVQIFSLEQENQTLIALRDSLLPKLMKGEIEI